MPQAQHNIGYIYQRGLGVAQDFKEAMKWYRLAAEQDLADAQNNLGVMYLNGLAVPRDFKEALRLFRLAAAQEYPMAKRNIGYVHLYGMGVRKDYREALKWFSQAARQGDLEAEAQVEKLKKRGFELTEEEETELQNKYGPYWQG
jgi:hypothetical protein